MFQFQSKQLPSLEAVGWCRIGEEESHTFLLPWMGEYSDPSWRE